MNAINGADLVSEDNVVSNDLTPPSVNQVSDTRLESLIPQSKSMKLSTIEFARGSTSLGMHVDPSLPIKERISDYVRAHSARNSRSRITVREKVLICRYLKENLRSHQNF